jgi:transcriptional regulator with XRE-family HTH domain
MQKMMRQKDLVAALGVQQRVVTRWENDEARPRQKTLEKLAEVLGVTVEELTVQAKDEPFAALVDDPELQELLVDLPKLQQNQRDALKTVLRDMLAKCRMEAALRGA